MIYADNAATTPVSDCAAKAVCECMQSTCGNPSSLHSAGQRAAQLLFEARQIFANCLNCLPREIYFTSCGSESDNQAIISAAAAGKKRNKTHIISTAVEHHAVLHTLEKLKAQGFDVQLLEPGTNGAVTAQQVADAVRSDTCLVTVMYANNEIGTINPIADIGTACREKGVPFHTDAVQAAGHIPIDVRADNIDMLSLSAHKFYGPKGIGFLYIRTGVKIRSFVHGGAQERKRRAGTENVPGIIGMAKAAQIAHAHMAEWNEKEIAMRDHMIDRVLAEIPYSRLNGGRTNRLPNNVNFSFQFVEGESMLIMLDMKGICASSGSACASGSLDPSHVLLGIGLPHEIAHGSVRLTLSDETTMDDIDYTVDALKEIVAQLRSMSPLYEDFVKKQKK